MTKITLYDYQQIIVDQVREAMINEHKHILVQAPTGAGKTVMFSYIAQQAQSKGSRILILTDRNELRKETGNTLSDFGIIPKFITAGTMHPAPYMACGVIVGMARTLQNRIEPKRFKKEWLDFWNSFDMVIIDECHKQDFNKFFENDIFKCRVLGFTATPKRSGSQRQLAEDYSKLIEGPSTQELIDKGFLVSSRDYVIAGVNTDGIRKNNKGDYDEAEMYERFNRREIYEGSVDNWLEHTPFTITIGFAVNIEHTIRLCEEFNNRGIKSKFIVSDVAKPKRTGDSEADIVKYNEDVAKYELYKSAFAKYSGNRAEIIAEWKRGDFLVLWNAGILTTGFNFKGIETVILSRATASANLYLQMIGRGSRALAGKTHFNILDLGNNIETHHPYNFRRKYNLIHERKGGGGTAVVKECGTAKRKGFKNDLGYWTDKNGREGCGCYLHASQNICKYCGYIFEPDKQTEKALLRDVTEDNIIPLKDMDFVDKIEREARQKGRNTTWVIHNVIAQGGEDALKKYVKKKSHSIGRFFHLKKFYKKSLDNYNKKVVD